MTKFRYWFRVSLLVKGAQQVGHKERSAQMEVVECQRDYNYFRDVYSNFLNKYCDSDWFDLSLRWKSATLHYSIV